MIKFSRGENFYFSKSKILRQFLKIVRDDGRMADGIPTILVGPGIETGKIVILYGFVFCSFIMQFDGTGSTTKKLSRGSSLS